VIIRHLAAADCPQILALNEESVHFLSLLTLERLQLLRAHSALQRVVEVDGRVAAFILALREGTPYDSPNYRWFAERYDHFLYIDRVVVSAAQQGRGIGRRLYDDLLTFARSTNVALVACEFDIDPPNPQSERFHRSFGFEEVGTQTYGPTGKRVSLQILRPDR
jgi:predicted GNAT superfamily acetyltransferase